MARVARTARMLRKGKFFMVPLFIRSLELIARPSGPSKHNARERDESAKRK